MPEVTVSTEGTTTTPAAPAVPVDAIIEIAKETGETAAKTEKLEEIAEELEQKTENLESRQDYTREDIDRMYTRIFDLENRVGSLELKEANEEENIPGIHEGEETEIEKESAPTIPAPKKKHNFFF
jgi:chromosome segregation ATPase